MTGKMGMIVTGGDWEGGDGFEGAGDFVCFRSWKGKTCSSNRTCRET